MVPLMLPALAKIIKQEGPLALYNGLEATLWRYRYHLEKMLTKTYLVERGIFWLYSSSAIVIA